MAMEEVRLNFIKHYQILSSDDKPDVPVSQSAGCTLHIVDTGEQYVFHGGMWEKDLRLVCAIQQANLL